MAVASPASEAADLVRRNVFAVSGELTEPLLNVMIVMRNLCGGDLDKALMMLMVTVRSSTHPDFRALMSGQVQSDAEPVLPSFGTNVSSIAASIGIPNETARRKMHELIKAGWVVRHRGRLKYTPTGYAAVAAAREEIIRMYAKGHEAIGKLQASAAAGGAE